MIHSAQVIILSWQEWSDATINPYASWLNYNIQTLIYLKQWDVDNKNKSIRLRNNNITL